jgi:hypothetical protein
MRYPVQLDPLTLRLDRRAQIDRVRESARQACTDRGHTLGAWRSAGPVADDAAICETCGGRLFLLYGPALVQPLVGARIFGTAYGTSCRPASVRRHA